MEYNCNFFYREKYFYIYYIPICGVIILLSNVIQNKIISQGTRIFIFQFTQI